MKTNYHTHTYRCHHAEPDERKYIETAIREHFEVLGFSDHTPYPFDDDYVSPMRMTTDETAGYVATLSALRDEYRGKIDIHIGFEAEYFPALFDRLLEHLDAFPYEYLILGEHYSVDERTSRYNALPSDDPAHLDAYAESCTRALNTGAFSCFAHPDLLCFTGDETYYRSVMRRLCREAFACRVPLEFNLLGFGDHRRYPRRTFWEEAAVVGNPVVLGWDAHTASWLTHAEWEHDARTELSTLGLTVIDTFPLIRPERH